MLTEGTHRVELNGVDHWIRVEAADAPGAPVVLLHGGPGANASLLEATVGPHLAKTHPVVYYDQRGCGRSAPATSYSIAELVNDLDLLREALELEAMNLAGFSFGGQLAAEYAVRHPAHVDRLILVAPSILGPLRWDNRLAGMDAVADPEFRRLLRQASPSLEFGLGEPAIGALRELWRAMDSATGARFSQHDPSIPRPPDPTGNPANREFGLAVMSERRDRPLLDELAEVDRPTLVIVGLYDRNVGVDACRDIVDRMPNAALSVLLGSGHAPIEEPEAYAAAMTAFLVS